MIETQSVLVTGAGGFIGSHLVEQLVQSGAKVRAFVRYTSRFQAGFLDDLNPVTRQEIEIIQGDLRDYDAVLKCSQGVQTIFHLGALIGIPYSYVHPRETIDVNIIGTFNVLAAAQHHSVERIVHTSSSEVYGTAQYVPIDEQHPLQGQSPYSASKIAADKLAESFYRSYSLPVITLRPFNTFGPRQSARAVIPTIISQTLKGNTIKLGDLTPTRDFTYVSDTANGFIKAATTENVIGQTINLGTGNEISIGDLVQKIGEIMGKEIKIVTDSIRQRPKDSEVERLLSNNHLAKTVLQWDPQISLEQGLIKTIEWINKNSYLFNTEHYVI